MRDYIFKRPMLLSAIICVTFCVTIFYSGAVFTAFGIFYAIFLGIFIYKGIKPQILVALVMAFVMILSLASEYVKSENINTLDKSRFTAEAVVLNVTNEEKNYSAAIMEIVKDENLPDMKISAVYYNKKLHAGQRIKADFKFGKFENRTSKSYYYGEGVYISANVYNIEIIEGKEDFVLRGVENVRHYIRNTLFSNMEYENASTMAALTFGDRSYFTDEFYSNVKCAGVSHVMVVSGMHLSILVILCLKIIGKFVANRHLKAFVMAAVVLTLITLCGFTMSILRAGITYAFLAISFIINRDNDSANSLGAAVVAVLIFSPFAVLSVAFQLSVLSTFGILAVALPITEYLENRRIIKSKIKLTIFSAVIITLSATLLTLPVSIYTFGYVSVVSVITNLLISYAVTLTLSVAMIALILNLFFPAFSSLMFGFCDILTSYINYVINYFGSLPFSTVRMPRWSAILAVLIIILIFYALLTCKKRMDMIKSNYLVNKKIYEKGRRRKWR